MLRGEDDLNEHMGTGGSLGLQAPSKGLWAPLEYVKEEATAAAHALEPGRPLPKKGSLTTGFGSNGLDSCLHLWEAKFPASHPKMLQEAQTESPPS